MNAKSKDPIKTSAKMIWRDVYKQELSFEDFFKLSQMNCYYCDAGPSNVFNMFKNRKHSYAETIANGNFVYNGLDRVDSSKNHSIDNVVTCCKYCNFAKSNVSQKEFFVWAIRVYNNLKSIGEING